MADERNFPYGIAWILFLVAIIAAVVMMSSSGPVLPWIGLGILLLPMLIFSTVLGLYYWRTRRMAT